MQPASDPVYLDHNATTPVIPEVLEAMLPYFSVEFGNAGSAHVFGDAPRRAITRAREQVAALLNARPEEIHFTSGGVEANSLAIKGVAATSDRRQIVTSNVEHPATVNPCWDLAQEGWIIHRAPVDGVGRLRTQEAGISEATALVTVMHANNETGTLQPIEDLSSQTKRVGALTHTDAAQSAGKVPVDVDLLGVDLLSIVGHKLYAPKGIGALYVRKGTPIAPSLFGRSPGAGLRPGTLNVPSIVGLGQACEVALRDLHEESQRLRTIRDALWEGLRARIPGIRWNGSAEHALPNTLNVRFPHISAQALLERIPRIAVSMGAACHSGETRASQVLLSMGLTETEARASVRLSVGRLVGEGAISMVIDEIHCAWLDLAGMQPH